MTESNYIIVSSHARIGSYALFRPRHTTIILICLGLMFIGDSANSLLLHLGSSFYRVSIFIRVFVQMYFMLLLARKRQGFYTLGLYLLIVTIFIVGSLFAVGAVGNLQPYNWFENFNIINKMMFLFISWETLNVYFKSSRDQSRLFRVFEILVILQTLAVLVGFVFKLDFLSSYGQDYKFGYRGFIPARNEVSGFFVISFFYYLCQVVYFKRGILQLIVVTIAGLLTGTKVTLILPAILLLYIARWLLSGRLNKRYFLISLVIVGMVVGGLLYKDYLLSRLEPTISYYTYRLVQLDYSIIDIASSGRSFLLNDFISDYLPRFNPLNIFFGGLDMSYFSTETDLIDVFARLGVIGGFVFYFFYLRVLLYPIRNRIRFTPLVFVITWLGVSVVAGHLVFSAINGIYLAILLLSFALIESNRNLRLN